MSSLNMMRGLLVGGAAFAVLVALVFGLWSVAIILGVGIAAHAALWVHLYRSGVIAPAARPSSEPPAAGAGHQLFE